MHFPIALIGEALVDVFPDHEVMGGAPFNVARHLASLGTAPLFVTRIGDDPRGRAIRDDFTRFGMADHALQCDAARPTGHVMVRTDGTHHTFEIAPAQAWDRIDAPAAMEAVQAAAPAIMVFGTLAQRDPASRAAVHAVLQATPALRVADLNLRATGDDRMLAEASLQLADIVKVNDSELQQLLNWFAPMGNAHTLVAQFGLKRLITTRGADGWACVDAVAGEGHGTAPPVAVVDTVGAGDAFLAVVLIGELHRWAPHVTLERAARLASAVCGIHGAVAAGHPMHALARAEWAQGYT